MFSNYGAREQTAYYIQGQNKNSEYLIQLLADMVQSPTLDKTAILRERYVIKCEYEGSFLI